MLEQLRTIMDQYLEVSMPEQLKETDRLFEDLNVDSIAVLQLIVYIEEEFGVSIPEEGVDPAVFGTIGALLDFVIDLKNAASDSQV